MSIDQKNSSLLLSETQSNLPNVGITMGDPAGIGPEIVVKALADKKLSGFCNPFVIGDLRLLRETTSSLGADVSFENISAGIASGNVFDTVPVFDLDNLEGGFTRGAESAVAGRASAEYIREAVKLWEDGSIDAITTAPINKKAFELGGSKFPGHTEFLASLTGSKRFAMSFFAGGLCVVLHSVHVSLSEAIGLVKMESLVDLIRFTNRHVSSLLNKDIKIAVAGLNPHASENGMFGTEEESEIIPAIARCSEEFGIEVSGPFSPDTVFIRGFKGEFDAVISLYHDQATIAVKCLSFGSSVNVTLGLPLIRTSVDHGTAYDIAGKNVADSSSLEAAVKLASHFAAIRNKSWKSDSI